MGFIVWYQLAFRPSESLPPLLKISNDIASGGFPVDAEITTKARVGATVSSFEATLHDLPKPAADLLRARSDAGELVVDIQLGYFDRPTERKPVMRAVVTEVTSKVANGELLTVLKGQELAGFRLLHTAFGFHQTGLTPLTAILGEITSATKVNVLAGSELAGTRADLTVATTSALEVVERVAGETKVPLAIRDGIIHLGAPVTTGAPATFDSRTNLVKQSKREQQDGPDNKVTVHELTVLGDPQLFLGQKVRAPKGPDLVITSLTHKFLASGFVTELEAVAGKLTGPKVKTTGLEGFVDGLMDRILAATRDHPAVRVGDVTGYRPGGDGEHGGHRATLHFGQNPDPEITAPSVDAEVATDLLLHDKPVAAPFAWDRCGLIVPVYEGMRAVLAHNGGEVNDAVAAGFVWSRAAGHTPPPNKPGDYWLCLPTQVTNGRPTGKGVNDLTDATGRRVVQAAGLALEVGREALVDLGKRPEELPADDTLVIRHASGTTITIDSTGALSIETKGNALSIGDGTASITIEKGTITLAASKVDVVKSNG